MPRKAKEKDIATNNIDDLEKVVKSKVTEKNNTKATTKKSNAKNDTKVGTKKSTKTSAKNDTKVDTKKSTKTIAKNDTKVDTKKSTKTIAKNDTKIDTKKSTKTKSSKNTSKKTEPLLESKAGNTKKTRSSSTNSKASNTTKKNSSKTSTTKKSTLARSKTASSKKKSNSIEKVSNNSTGLEVLEYYDLPYKYGNTLVKLLAQTPKTLFVYWEISDLDIENYKKKFGNDFFNITKPILIVHNLTLNKTYEVEINDFANCWYLSTEDSDCKFDIELARKFTNFNNKQNNNYIENNNLIKNDNSVQNNNQIQNQSNEENNNLQAQQTFVLNGNYLYIAKSNDLLSPNDHILFEKLTNFVKFKNVETGEVINRNIQSVNFLNNLYKFYKDMYKDDLLKNPSSSFII